jgi:protein gp37
VNPVTFGGFANEGDDRTKKKSYSNSHIDFVFFKKKKINDSGRFWAKPSKIFLNDFGQNCPESVLDDLCQTVWNCGQFGPNRP